MSKQLNFSPFLRTLWLRLCITSCLFLAGSNVSYADLPIAEEYQVKAVFLLNFASFITWPPSAFASPSAPFNICILGEDPFGVEVDITVENEKIEGHAVAVQRLSNLKNTTPCQILFISQSEKDNLTNFLTALQQRPILTVSDNDEFVKNGGMIQFFKQGTKVRFLVDPSNVKGVGLQVSGNLLRIAKLYQR